MVSTEVPGPDPDEKPAPTIRDLYRDRLLSTLIVISALSLLLALPFALRAGSVFFVPIASAIVLGLALSPLADWLNRRGLPNTMASLAAIAFMLLLIGAAGALVVVPATDLVDSLPQFVRRLSERASSLLASFADLSRMFEEVAGKADPASASSSAGGLRDGILSFALHTPQTVLQSFVTIMLTYFILESRLRVRRQILLERSDLASSMRAARVFRDVQNQIGTYFSTTIVIAGGVGLIVGLGAYLLGWERPVMWGGLAAFLNLIPYIGPLTMVVLLSLFGLSGTEPVAGALFPALAYLVLHTVESNVVNPMLVGKRLAISPGVILVSLLFFGWIWGIAGLFLAVPLLLLFSSLLEHVGRPNLIGFLFGEPLFPEAAATHA